MWILAELTRVTGVTDDHLREAGPSRWQFARDGMAGQKKEKKEKEEKKKLLHTDQTKVQEVLADPPQKKEIKKYDLPTLTLLLVAQWWQLPTLLHRISFFPTTVKTCCKTIEWTLNRSRTQPKTTFCQKNFEIFWIYRTQVAHIAKAFLCSQMIHSVDFSKVLISKVT